MTKRKRTLTLGKLLALVFTNPKARFQVSYPVYSVSGAGQRKFLIPETGIRALQCHSPDDVGLEVATAAQAEFIYRTSRLPEYCVHGTSLKAWAEHVHWTRCLMRGGPMRARRGDHFALRLPGDTGRIVSGFRVGSRIYFIFDLRLVAPRKASLPFHQQCHLHV